MNAFNVGIAEGQCDALLYPIIQFTVGTDHNKSFWQIIRFFKTKSLSCLKSLNRIMSLLYLTATCYSTYCGYMLIANA